MWPEIVGREAGDLFSLFVLLLLLLILFVVLRMNLMRNLCLNSRMTWGKFFLLPLLAVRLLLILMSLCLFLVFQLQLPFLAFKGDSKLKAYIRNFNFYFFGS